MSKTRKIDSAVEIFKKHLPKRDSMTKREFRKLVTDEMKDTLELKTAGTIGMYFAWADQLATGRPAKEYMRKGEPRKKRKTQEAEVKKEEETANLNRVANDFLAGKKAPVKKAAKKAATKKSTTKKKVSKADRLKMIAAAANKVQ